MEPERTVRFSGLGIVVGNDRDVRALKPLCVFGHKFARPAVVCRRRDADFPKHVGLLFALDDKNALTGLDRLQKFREAIGQRLGRGILVNKLFGLLWVRPPLQKRLSAPLCAVLIVPFIAHDLIRQDSLFVRIFVDGGQSGPVGNMRRDPVSVGVPMNRPLIVALMEPASLGHVLVGVDRRQGRPLVAIKSVAKIGRVFDRVTAFALPLHRRLARSYVEPVFAHPAGGMAA
ncbi:hypothetical protein [Loktanella sp. 3ANDIMAR09]|uniref:hypothetical protein n=1 Tax=Loktanella sp. 3ANDIMAR09 TaxID=1225657 RepID=UPI00209F2274|nr:hypothetical protein [Loktanella sp. 3ANDIMAR09]